MICKLEFDYGLKSQWHLVFNPLIIIFVALLTAPQLVRPGDGVCRVLTVIACLCQADTGHKLPDAGVFVFVCVCLRLMPDIDCLMQEWPVTVCLCLSQADAGHILPDTGVSGDGVFVFASGRCRT